VVLPENFGLIGSGEGAKLEAAESDGNGPMQQFLSAVAAKHSVWLVGGSVPLAGSDRDHVRQAALLYDARGRCVARYDKIHLFDVELEETDERYQESAVIEAGASPVVVNTPFGRVGMTVCYDLRFPELFRYLVDQGMEIAAVPSAFTKTTGEAHWEVLLRARSIENLCYTVAAAQGGCHSGGRETYGHSMIIDPWGVVLDELPQGSGFVTAEVDREKLARIRWSFPSITHRRMRCRF
jgi:nitrilase